MDPKLTKIKFSFFFNFWQCTLSKFQKISNLKTSSAPLITTIPTTSSEQFLPIGNRFGDDFDYVDSKNEEIQTTTFANIDEIGSNEMDVVTTNNYDKYNIGYSDLIENNTPSSMELQVENGIESSSSHVTNFITTTTTYIFINSNPSTNPSPSSDSVGDSQTDFTIEIQNSIPSLSTTQSTSNEPHSNSSPNRDPDLTIKIENSFSNLNVQKVDPPLQQNFNENIHRNPATEKNLNPMMPPSYPVPMKPQTDSHTQQQFSGTQTIQVKPAHAIPFYNPVPQTHSHPMTHQSSGTQNFNPNLAIQNSYNVGQPPLPIPAPPITNNNAQPPKIHTIITNSNSPGAPQTIYVIQNPQHPYRIKFTKLAKPSVKNQFTNIALKICKNGEHVNDIRVESKFC